MKKIFLFLIVIFTLNGCDKDSDNPPPTNPVDQLPPPTQIGANKVGCLLDGKVFLPDNESNTTNCYYQFVDGGYFFHVSLSKRNTNHNIIGLAINTNKLTIMEGQTYLLTENLLGNATGGFYFLYNIAFTDEKNNGELTITKLDFTKNIVSGTFWYDVKDSDGIIHQIREGRFDMQFTQ